MRGLQTKTQPPIEVYYRRNSSDTWLAFKTVTAFRTTRDALQNTSLSFRAEGSNEVLDRWSARFWAEMIVVRNYAASSDILYYPRIEARCEKDAFGFEVALTAHPSPLPDVPRELLGWTGAHPTHLSLTANRTRFEHSLALFFAFPSPMTGAPGKLSLDAPDKSITLGRGAGMRSSRPPVSLRKTLS
jgi:hypothetical protein